MFDNYHSDGAEYVKRFQGHRNNATGKYRQTSNRSCILVGNNIVDHSDVVGTSPVGAAPTTS